MIDMHVHYFPPKLFRAIWEYFETKENDLWPIRYKLDGGALIDELNRQGVSRFTTLVYAHKPGMAESLNTFIYNSAKRHPALIPFGTIYAGDGNTAAEAKRIFEDYDFNGIKLHPMVSLEPINHPGFFPAYEMMESMGKILLCHTGSGPRREKGDGAKQLLAVLERFPRLKVIVAHSGAPEYREHQALSDRFESVYFDTAMNCIQHPAFPDSSPGSEFFLSYSDRIVFGSDFPHIPHAYQHQVDSLKALNLGEEIEAKIFAGNAHKLLGI